MKNIDPTRIAPPLADLMPGEAKKNGEMARDTTNRQELDRLVHLMTVMTEARLEAAAVPTLENVRVAEAAAEEFKRAADALIAGVAQALDG
jgi:hypothetical protein